MSDIHDAIDRLKSAIDQAAFDLKSSVDAINMIDEIDQLRDWLVVQQKRIAKKNSLDMADFLS